MVQPQLVHEEMAWKQKMGRFLVWMFLDKAFVFIYKVKKLDYQDIQIFPSYKSSTRTEESGLLYEKQKPIIFQEQHLYVRLHSVAFFMYDKL